MLGAAVDFNWVAQPAEPGTYRTEISWQAPAGTAAAITSSLRGWDRLRFEVTEEPTASPRVPATATRPTSASSTP